MPTLLLELFSEEIPSRMQRSGAEQLQRLMNEGFKKNMLALAECKTFVSPRHLAIQCFGLPAIQPDVREERRGPKIGAPEQALKGFLGSTGLTLEQCEQRDGYYYATIEKKGRAVADVVKEICESALTSFVWPKSMHWGDRKERPVAWVRPLHKITCLLDDKIVPVQFGHLAASNVTHGHHFLSPGEITIPHAEEYEGLLADANVMVDFTKRREVIATGIAKVAAEAKLTLHNDDALLDEVTGLVEHPVPLLCEFDAKFLDLPPEVLISEMKNHQRYFALYGADNKLTNRFITVANMVNADGGARVKDGNARVVRARLADGEFYWEQDRKVKLEDWGKKLSDVVFHAKVGMMDKKVERIEALAVEIAKAVGYNDEASARRAAQLCKADLTSGMVGEFPELQGIMGRYYALEQGESPEIADAIRDHYKPLGATDFVPNTILSNIISLADKFDSISTLFANGEVPTGSKDPLAIRRSAIGSLRILLTKNLDLDLLSLISHCLLFFSIQKAVLDADKLREAVSSLNLLEYRKTFESIEKELKHIMGADGLLIGADHYSPEDIALNISKVMSTTKKIIEFFHERLNTMMRDEGVRHDVIEAVSSDEKTFIPTARYAQAKALAAWLETATGKDALAAIKRAMNILAAEEKKEKKKFAADVKAAVEPAEKAIAAALQQVQKNTASGPACLEALTAPINQFFEQHLVNEDGKREGRLALLAAVREAANQIADFSKIEG